MTGDEVQAEIDAARAARRARTGKKASVRVVADTNVIVSALLCGGMPRLLLDAAEAQHLELFTSRALIAELDEVLSREKLAAPLKQTRYSASYLVFDFVGDQDDGAQVATDKD